jgi:hypothetical protein
MPIQSVCAKHRAAKKDQRELNRRYRHHDKKKSFIFSDMGKESNTARSGIKRIENAAENKKREKSRHKTDKI